MTGDKNSRSSPKRTSVGRVVLVISGLVIALLAALGWFRTFEGSGELEPTLSPSSDRSIESEQAATRAFEAPAADARQSVNQRTEVVAEAAPAAAAAPDADADACVVLGRVVDEDDRPIVQARVRLAANEVWTEGVEVPRLDGPYDYCGFEVTTDGAGEFRITAPVPTAERTWLTIEPDPHHDSCRVIFGGQRGQDQPSLRAGERDLGVVRLATTGAIRGRVTDSSGRPLAEVKMGIGSTRSLTYSRDTETAADGSYLIAHAPIGNYGVKARAEGYLAQFRESVQAEAARDTLDIDFVLEPAPTLEGIVHDENGRPIEGARVWGWASSGGKSARANSSVDGRFVISLPQDEPYTLAAKLDGYRSWGEVYDYSVIFRPGTRDIEVTLHSMPRVRFSIVDAASGEAIERFGLKIFENSGSHAPRRSIGRILIVSQPPRQGPPPRQGEYPGGVIEVGARAGVDLYLVAAEGYITAAGDVAPSSPDSPHQIVRMKRGGKVVGRVLRDGEPLADVRVELKRGFMRRAREVDRGERAPLEFRAGDQAPHSTQSGADGRFELDVLEYGKYRITLRPLQGAPLVVAPLKVSSRGITDAGDFHLVLGAAIDGHVLLPPGIAPGGLALWLDDRHDGISTIMNSAGNFRFEQLEPGTHTLTLDDRPGELAASEAVDVELISGGRLSVTLDARDRGTCQVTLEIDLGEHSAEGRRIDLLSVSDPRERVMLGKCDESGRVTGHPRAWGEARVLLWLPGHRLEHPTARLRLEQGSELEEQVRFELSSVTLVLPAGVEPASSGEAILRLRTSGAEEHPFTTGLWFKEGQPDGAMNGTARAAAGSLWFGLLPAGAYELNLELIDDETEGQRVDLGGGRYRFLKPAFWRASRQVVLRADEELRVEFD